MPLSSSGNAPYTTAQAATTAITAFRDRGMGTPITPDTLIRAGVPESIAARTLASLKALDLVAETGEPTQQFNDLRLARGDEEYHARLQEWIKAVYADVLLYTNPAEHTPDRVAEAFRTYEPAGQRRAMAALLIGLWKFSGLPVPEGSQPPRAPRTPAARRPRPAARTQRAAPASRPSPVFHGGGDTPGDLPAGLVGLIQQIPRNGASWTTKRRDAFVKAFEAALDFTVPVDDDPQVAAEDPVDADA